MQEVVQGRELGTCSCTVAGGDCDIIGRAVSGSMVDRVLGFFVS
jgi:hypothetical protein